MTLEDVLRAAAALEATSEHPIASAIMSFAAARLAPPPTPAPPPFSPLESETNPLKGGESFSSWGDWGVEVGVGVEVGAGVVIGGGGVVGVGGDIAMMPQKLKTDRNLDWVPAATDVQITQGTSSRFMASRNHTAFSWPKKTIDQWCENAEEILLATSSCAVMNQSTAI